MWISKEADVRKKELLDTALDLFYERGYENTSINDIIKKVGVTKGSFYYHFKSKEEVLDTIALQQAQEMVGVFAEAAAASTGNCLDKINGIIADMQSYRAKTHEKRHKIFDVLDRTENLKLRQKIYENYMRLSRPTVSELIGQGLKEGVIRTAYPDELAEYYIHYSISINGILNKLIGELGQKPENIEIIRNKAYFFEEALTKLLGAKEGSVRFAEPVLRCRVRDNGQDGMI